MSQKLTRITEITTGLGTLPAIDLSQVFSASEPPSELRGVDAVTWSAMCDYWASGDDREVFEASFADGRYFFESGRALRARPPEQVEWRGPVQLPESDPLPMDLRIDDVYVVSCKNLSKVLRNPSPTVLFRHGNTSGGRGSDWYAEIAPLEYNALLKAAVAHLGLGGFPATPADLTDAQKTMLKENLKRAWPSELAEPVAEFVRAVSIRSADALNSILATSRLREGLYWQFMRLHSSTYYILGKQPSGSGRLRVLTPWDFRSRYDFRGFEITADDAGQPQVQWLAAVFDNEIGELVETGGHIEIRWSHGRFNGAPESKIYLDTPYDKAAGYEPI